MNTGYACEQCIRTGIVIVVAVVVVGVTAYLVVLHSQNIAAGLAWLAQRFTNLPKHIPKLLQPKP
jgi:hypothetical protein